MSIALDAGTLSAGGGTWHVRASDGARQEALSAWRKKNTAAASAAVEWHPDLEKYGAEQLNERFTRRFAHAMSAGDWIGWMLVKIAVEARLRDVSLATARFDGHKGAPLTFGPDRHLVQPLCIVDNAGRLLGVNA
jgi:hypothetical protein